MRNKVAGIFLITLGIVVAAVPSVLAFRGFQRGIDDQNETFEWPSADGWITRSDSDGDEVEVRYVYLEYTYQVAGTWFSSDRLYSRKYYESKAPSLRLDEHAELLQKYPVESSVRVYYDPQDPSNAALVLSPEAGLIPQYTLTALIVASGEILASLGAYLLMTRLPGPCVGAVIAGYNYIYHDPFCADRSVRDTRYISFTLLAVVLTVHISMVLTREYAWPAWFFFAYLVWLPFLGDYVEDLHVRKRGLHSIEGQARTKVHTEPDAPDRYTLQIGCRSIEIPESVYKEMVSFCPASVTVQYWEKRKHCDRFWLHTIRVGTWQLASPQTNMKLQTTTSS